MEELLKQLVTELQVLRNEVNNRFDEVYNHFDEVSNRFDEVNNRFDRVEKSQEELNEGFRHNATLMTENITDIRKHSSINESFQ